MQKLNQSVKEWNAIVEALGQGKQTILIRSYEPAYNHFLLNPTTSYALKKEDYLNNFKEEYRSFVKENKLPKRENNKTLIKYYAKVEKVVHDNDIERKTHIWSNDHVKFYLKRNKAIIWVLRVYKLKTPYYAYSSHYAMKYANLDRGVSIRGIKPVMSNEEFSEILKTF